jgi:hypothetical protein
MNFADRDIADRPPLPLGIGAALVAPVTLFGTFTLADYPGPYSFTEYFGWWGLCLAVAAGAAGLLRQFRRRSRFRLVFLLFGVSVPIIFSALFYADIHPDTPLSVKAAFEHSLQVIGVPTIGALLAFIGWLAWNSRRA